jgi:hypothetical protein
MPALKTLAIQSSTSMPASIVLQKGKDEYATLTASRPFPPSGFDIRLGRSPGLYYAHNMERDP